MGRYSSWWSRLLIIGIVAAVITPVGIYAVPQLTPSLNLMEFYENPANTEVREMVFIASDADENGKWTWCLNRLDIAFKNPLDKKLLVPKSDASVKYFGGRLGNGFIAQEYEIGPHETVIVSMYLKTYNVGTQAELFSRFLKAQFWGQDLTLNVNINAYILIDGVLGEPLIGLKFPMTIKNPLPFGLYGWDPLIHEIVTGNVEDNKPVTVTFKASDPGTGISDRVYIYYRIDGVGEWEDKSVYDGFVKVNNPYWDDTFRGLSLGKSLPIASSYTDNPVEFTASIPAQSEYSKVEYYIYLEDYAGNWQHEKQANYYESEVITYTVPEIGETVLETGIRYNVSWEDPFIIRYLQYLDSHGTNLQHYLYTLGIKMLGLLPLINTFSETLYTLDVDMDYILALLTTDFIKSLRVMADSGVPPGIMMEILGDLFNFTFSDMVEYILPRIWFPFENDTNINQLADNAFNLEGDEKDVLEAKFNSIGISGQDMIDYINPSGIIGPDVEEFRNIVTLELKITDDIIIRIQGGIVRDWNYNDAPGDTVYEKWLDLVRTGNETNGHWAAANLILKSSYADNPPDTTQELFPELLNTKLSAIPEAFPANDLYPYTHQLVSLVMLLCLGVVSYLVLKREILIHRKVERGLAAKKKMQQKAVFDKDAKNKAQSKYL